MKKMTNTEKLAKKIVDRVKSRKCTYLSAFKHYNNEIEKLAKQQKQSSFEMHFRVETLVYRIRDSK